MAEETEAGCTRRPTYELPKFQRSQKKYQKLQGFYVEVLFVSIDSIFVHEMWDDDELQKMVPAGALARKP